MTGTTPSGDEKVLGIDGTPVHAEWPRWYAHVAERAGGGWVWQLMCRSWEHGRKILVADGEEPTEERALEAARVEKEGRAARLRAEQRDYEVEL